MFKSKTDTLPSNDYVEEEVVAAESVSEPAPQISPTQPMVLPNKRVI